MKRIVILGLIVIGCLLTAAYWPQPEKAKTTADRLPSSDSSSSTKIVTLGTPQQ